MAAQRRSVRKKMAYKWGLGEDLSKYNIYVLTIGKTRRSVRIRDPSQNIRSLTPIYQQDQGRHYLFTELHWVLARATTFAFDHMTECSDWLLAFSSVSLRIGPSMFFVSDTRPQFSNLMQPSLLSTKQESQGSDPTHRDTTPWQRLRQRAWRR